MSSHRAARASQSTGPGRTPGHGPPRHSLLKHVALGVGIATCVVVGFAQRDKSKKQLTPIVHHGYAGVKHTASGEEVRWRTRRTEVTIDASVEKYGPTAVRAVQNAFGTWLVSDPKLPELTFNTTRGARVEAAPDGKNTVLVAPIRIKGHEHDLAVTLTYSNEETGAIVEADIVINEEHAFRVFGRDGDGAVNDDDDRDDDDDDDDKTKAAAKVTAAVAPLAAVRMSCMAGGASTCGDGAYDLQNIVTHEVGHFLGLGEDMTDNAATMFYCTSRCETHKRVLTEADTGSISTLYLAAVNDGSEEAAPAGCGARFVPHGNLREAAAALSAVVLLLLTRRRRLA